MTSTGEVGFSTDLSGFQTYWDLTSNVIETVQSGSKHQDVYSRAMRNLALFAVFLLVCTNQVIAGQEKDSANQIPTKPLEIRVTQIPKWQNGCLKIAYEVVNQTATTLWLPINGSRVNAAVRVAASKQGTPAKDDWVSITPFFDNGPWSAAPMPPGRTDHEEPCFPKTFHVSKSSGGRGRNLPIRMQIQIVIEYFLTEQDWQTNMSQHEAMMMQRGAEWEHLQSELLHPRAASVILTVPCYPGERESK
jgi:hypothetical protein